MMNTSKRTLGTLGFTAGLVFFGHWLDFYQMIKPGVWYNYEHKTHMSHAHHGHDAHSENTYKIDNNDTKAVLTYYQHDENNHDGHEHNDHNDSHDNHAHEGDHDDHAHDSHAHDDHGHDNHGDTHAHGDDHGHTAHAEIPSFMFGVHAPGFLEIGTFLGFLGLFLFVMFSSMAKVSLYPKNDPYLQESEHHDTGIGVVKEPH